MPGTRAVKAICISALESQTVRWGLSRNVLLQFVVKTDWKMRRDMGCCYTVVHSIRITSLRRFPVAYAHDIHTVVLTSSPSRAQSKISQIAAVMHHCKDLRLMSSHRSCIALFERVDICCHQDIETTWHGLNLQELGAAGQTKRPSSCMLLVREAQKGGLAGDDLKEYQELYDQVFKKMKSVQVIF